MTQQYVPPPAHQPYYPPPMPQRSNGVATGGFVVALCGAVLSLVPLLGIVSWIICPIGLVLSVVGLVKARELGGRGLSVAGVVLGAIGLLVCLLWLIGFAAATSPTNGSSSYSSPSYYSSAPTWSAQTTPTTRTMPSVTGPFQAGTYLVGEELTAGTYRTDGSGGSCYWERLTNTSGEFEAIITNDIVTGPSTMTVSASDGAVRFSGDCTWTRR